MIFAGMAPMASLSEPKKYKKLLSQMLVGDFLFIFVAKFFTVLYRKSLEFATNLFDILFSD